MREIKFRGWHTTRKKMFSAEEMTADQLTLLPTGSFVHPDPNIGKIKVSHRNSCLNKPTKAAKEIKKAIKLFVTRIKEIGNDYPEVGIGDTSTDEAIVAKVYEEMY